jgi:hypothetical protein
MDGDLSPEIQQQRQLFLRGVCRHLVCLTGTVVELKNAVRKKDFFNISGFVVSLYGDWIFVTAGHALKRLDERVERGELAIVECSLADYFGLDVETGLGIPFNYGDATKRYVDDDTLGLDFGLIFLHSHYRRLMEKNVRAIPYENWELRQQLEFDHYGVLGFPEELFDRRRRVSVCGETIVGGVRPVLMMGQQTDYLPDYKPTPEYTWLGVKLKDKTEIISIVGMSGGPILGFKDQPNKAPLYTIVGVQSWWDKEHRIAYGSSLPVIISPFEQLARALLTERDAAALGTPQAQVE